MRAVRVVVAGLMLATAVLVGLAPSAEADSTSVGFTPVRSGAAERSSIAAVADGDVWVAGKAADGKVRLEHLQRGRWWTTKLPVAADDTLQISGSGPRDVWLVSGGQLWHYTLGWRKVALPGSERATAVLDVVGKNVYVGTTRAETGPYGPDSVARLFRFDGRNWTDLGGPELPDDWQSTGTKSVERIVATGGQLYAEVLFRPPSATVIHEVYRVADGWTRLLRTGQRTSGYNDRTAGWLSYPDQTQMFLGYSVTMAPTTLVCSQVTGTAVSACPVASTAVSRAVLLPDGTAVLGGQDWTRLEGSSTLVTEQGTFLLRARDGSETALSGDPSDRTVAMSATPGGGQVWAITVEGDRSSIQRYRR